MKDYFLVFWECSYCFPKNTRSVDIPTSSRWRFLFPHIQQWLFIYVCILFLIWEHFVIWICSAWCENLFSENLKIFTAYSSLLHWDPVVLLHLVCSPSSLLISLPFSWCLWQIWRMISSKPSSTSIIILNQAFLHCKVSSCLCPPITCSLS